MTPVFNASVTRSAALIQDFSGFGRCSITVALPVLSCMGIHTSCVPTAVLSTHTGGFTGYTFRDLTEDIPGILDHWKKESFTFDALYTGYLGSVRQLCEVERFLTDFRTDRTLALVDPVFGDHGRLYSRMTPEMVEGIKNLCKKADVIVPNMTEAAFLTGMPYREENHDKNYLTALCGRLQELGCGRAVVTGVSMEKDTIGACALIGGELFVYAPERIPVHYDGTGDLFASVLLGTLLRGGTLQDGMVRAADFVRLCIQNSVVKGTNEHWGVDFEEMLPALM